MINGKKISFKDCIIKENIKMKCFARSNVLLVERTRRTESVVFYPTEAMFITKTVSQN